ncbi:hypothetical protein lerEdw1_002214 [Lerista edwardsae]|nr:hypothetical protein lerEdw1_002214 [Lerista edwardsae]
MAATGRLVLLLTVSLQFLSHLVLGQVTVNNTTTEPTSLPTSSPGGLSTAAVSAIIAVCCVLGGFLLIGLMVFVGFKVREKRQTEGTYRPSSEEQVGARVETNTNLKLPPEERLI